MSGNLYNKFKKRIQCDNQLNSTKLLIFYEH